MGSQNTNHIKSIKNLKSPKKIQDCNDLKIDEVFLNSEYFKHHSGNVSSLSFCSGDNGENQWTIESKCEIPFRQKSIKMSSHKSDVIKSDTAVVTEKEKIHTRWPSKMKKRISVEKESSQEKTENFLGGIFSEKESERDLISLVTEQMFLAERELQITRKHLTDTMSKLNERDLQIIQLHEKIKNLEETTKTKSAKTSAPNKEVDVTLNKTSEDYQKLVKASEKLKKQVKDMEEFLNDYGLVWVGKKEINQKPDFDKIMKSFVRLNAVASQPKIIQTTLGAKFELPRGLPVTFYSNGFLLRDSDFREYGKASTNFFLQDVEDGYFPIELQIEYPEGVPFEVVDKRNEVYNTNSKMKIFQGNGNRLGSKLENKSASIVYLEPVPYKKLESNLTSHQERCDRSPPRRLQIKRSKNFCLEETPTLHKSITNQKLLPNVPEETLENFGDSQLRIKIRFGSEKTDSFILEVPENKRMYAFQKLLQSKLCEKYHEQCIVDAELNKGPADFEFHIYGKNPFRLSDRLNQYPKECGITDHCVINIIEL